MDKLSEGALKVMMNGGVFNDPVLQVLSSKKVNSPNLNQDRYRLLVSDGKHSISSALFSFSKNEPHLEAVTEMYSIIIVKSFLSNVINVPRKGETRIVLLMSVELLEKGENVGSIIGNPKCIENFSSVSQNTPTASNNVSCPISSLNPFHNNWVVTARVTNKGNIRFWSNNRGKGKLFSFDILDKSGEMRCTVFEELVDKFYNLLEIDKVYKISKGIIRPADKRYALGTSTYEITLTSNSTIDHVVTENGMVPQVQYNFVSFDKIVVMEIGTVVDIIGVCKSASDIEEFTSRTTNRDLKKREVILVDQSQIALSLILWNNQAEEFDPTGNPVVLVKNAKLSDFAGGKNLNIGFSGCIKINPNTAESLRLRGWYDLGGYEVDFKNLSTRSVSSLKANWMTFKQVQDEFIDKQNVLYFQTYATILFARAERAVYKACPGVDCQKKVTDLQNGCYKCDKCNREYPNFKYRFLMIANAADATSSQWVTLFSSEAEKLLGKTADEVGKTMEQDVEEVNSLFDNLQFKQLMIKCRAKWETYNDAERMKVVVVGSEILNYQEYNNAIVLNLEKYKVPK